MTTVPKSAAAREQSLELQTGDRMTREQFTALTEKGDGPSRSNQFPE